MKLRARVKQKAQKHAPISNVSSGTKLVKLNNCKFCYKHTKSVEECAKHIFDKHLTDLKICPRCSQAFIDENLLLDHVGKHKKRSYSIYSCSKCPIYFSNCKLLERHEFVKHEDEATGVFLNQYCQFLSAYARMNFVLFYKKLYIPNAQFNCRLCKKVIFSKDVYFKHLQTKCSKEKYVCDRCCNVFFSRNTLTSHFFKNKHCLYQTYVSMVINKKKKNIRCKKCNKGFKTRPLFEGHWKSCRVAAYTCKDCDVSFSFLKDYNAHQAKLHPKFVETIKCKYCPTELISQKIMDKHVKQHERYFCLACDGKFQHPRALFYHLKTKHPDVEPFICKVCSISFYDRVKFSLHIKETHDTMGSISFDDKFYVTFSKRIGEDVPMIESNKLEEVTDSNKQSEEMTESSTPTKDSVTELNKPSKHVSESNNETEEATELNNTSDVVSISNNQSEEVTEPNNQSEVTESNIQIEEKSNLAMEEIDYLDEDLLEDRPLSEIRRRNTKRKIKNKLDTNRGIKTYVCKYCGKGSSNLVVYNKHMTSHFRKENQCNQCTKLFYNATELEQHMRDNHTSARNITNLRKYLQMRAKQKMDELKGMTASKYQKTALHPVVGRHPQARIPVQTYSIENKCRIKAFKVCEPTWELIQSKPQLRTSGIDMTITVKKGLPAVSKIDNLTLQQYLESFQPDMQSVSSYDAKRLNLNKSIKIRRIRTAVANKMFKIKATKCDIEAKYASTSDSLIKMTKITIPPKEHTIIKVKQLKDHEVQYNPNNLNLDFQEEFHMEGEDFYTSEYFETDDHNENVAQIEILSSQDVAPIGGQVYRAVQCDTGEIGQTEQYFIVHTTGEPSTQVTNIHQQFQIPEDGQLHVGKLTTSAPYFKIVNVKKAKTEQMQKNSMQKKKDEVIMVEGKKMTFVNPLEHLIKKSEIKIQEHKVNYGEIIAKSLSKLDNVTE